LIHAQATANEAIANPRIGADGFDDADGLVSHPLAGVAGLHLVVRPEIAAADSGAADIYERVRRLDQAGVADVSMRTSPAPYMTVARIAVYLALSASSGSSIASDDERSR
jgi:hypothetical protein